MARGLPEGVETYYPCTDEQGPLMEPGEGGGYIAVEDLPKVEQAVEERVQEALLGEKGRRIAAEAAYLDFDPTGDFDLLDEAVRMSWEGNTAAGIAAALTDALNSNGAEEGER